MKNGRLVALFVVCLGTLFFAGNVSAVPSGGQGAAVEQYRSAAEQGDAEAQFALGVCHYVGQGVGQSYQEAAKWYRKAAEQGLAKAQHNLGVCYENGQGVQGKRIKIAMG